MLLQILSTDSFFGFTDFLVSSGVSHARILVDMARAIGGIAAFFYISKRYLLQYIPQDDQHAARLLMGKGTCREYSISLDSLNFPVF